MSNRLTKFQFTPEENQQIEATILLPKESRSVIHGVVKNYKNCEVENAVVKVFEVVEHGGKYDLTPIGHTFTDEFGQFLFGPLCPNRQYVVKVWVNDIRIKEMVIKPEPDDTCEEEERKPHSKHIDKGYYRNTGRREEEDDDDDEDDDEK